MQSQRTTKQVSRFTLALAALAASTAVALAMALAPATAPTLAFASPEASAKPAPSTEQIRALVEGRSYVQGEAIVVAEAGAKLDVGASEKLARANSQALDQTTAGISADDESARAVAAERAEQSSARAYVVSVVRSDTLSTAELIAELYKDPQVISAEPNYLQQTAYAAKEGNQTTLASGSTALTTANVDEDGPQDPSVDSSRMGDLTSLQWGLNNAGTLNTPEGAAVKGVDMDVPAWDEHRNDGTAQGAVNASGTVAVLDSGMDENHPDLKDVFYTFTEEQQQRFGCGEHGLNASIASGDEGDVGDLTDMLDHGTHVCGIVAAAWNGEGVSGVANGAKLIGVRLMSDDGSQDLENNLRGFQFVKKIAREVNLKAINCSWSSEIGVIEFAFTLLVNQLGEQGVVTVFAAGNDGRDIGQNVQTQCLIDSPYLITVDAMNPAGGKVGFSNYSQTSTDVFAPGSRILSTVPDYVGGSAPGSEDKEYCYFYPETAYPDDAQAAQRLVGLSAFSDGTAGGVAAYSTDPTQGSAMEIGEISSEMGANDSHSLKIKLDDFTRAENDFDNPPTHGFSDGAYIAVPVDKGTDPATISYVSARVASNGKASQMGMGLFGFVATTKDGGTKLVSFAYDTSGFYNSAQATFGPFGWVGPTMDVAYLLDEDDEATGVYLDDQNRMVIQVGLLKALNEYDFDSIFFDDIAVGGARAQAGSYINFNGTSMAAPAVAGALAVVAKDEQPNAAYSAGDELGLQALKRSARLRAATVQTDKLDACCATGGYVNLAGLANYASTEEAPLAPTITSASTRLEAGKRLLDLSGYFFGDAQGASNVLIDGQETAIEQWADGRVVAVVPDSVQNGAHVACVQTAAGKDRYAFSTSYATDGLRLYENELATPDVAAFDTGAGPGKLCGGLVGSGDYLYTLQQDLKNSAMRLWRYSIADNEWSLCAGGELPSYNGKPLFNANTTDSVLAPTSGGVVLYATHYSGDENEWGHIVTSLFDYDATTDAWAKRDAPAELPASAGVFSKGDDLYFVGGRLDSLKDSMPTLCVLKPGAKKVKVLGSITKKELDDGAYGGTLTSYLERAKVAVTNSCIYAVGREPIGGAFKVPIGLTRLNIGEGGKVTSIENLTDSLVESGVVEANVYSEKGNWRRPEYSIQPAIAGLAGGIVTVGSSSAGADTYQLRDGESALAATTLSSSFFYPNAPMATWYGGKVYALGHNPSEPGKMYFRATELTIDSSSQAWRGQTDDEAAEETAELISALPAANGVTFDNIAAVMAAKNSYDELSAAARGKISAEDASKLNAAADTATAKAVEATTEAVKLAQELCEEAGIDYSEYLSPAENIAAAQKAIEETNGKAEKATAQIVCDAAGIAYYESKTPAENIEVAEAAIKKAVADAKTAAESVEAARKAQAQAEAQIAAAQRVAKNVKAVTVNAKAVDARAVAAAIAAVGGDARYVTTIVLGPKVKSVKASAFAKCPAAKTLQVQTKKLKKARVKGCLKGSAIKAVTVNVATPKAHAKLVKKYKAAFAKKNAGKKVRVQ